jgi:HlyD family secretion protein
MLDRIRTNADDNPTGESDEIESAERGGSASLRMRFPFWFALAAGIGVAAYALLSLGGFGTSVSYVTRPVMRGDLTVTVVASGSAQPVGQVSISSELYGAVRKVLVDHNSPVREGQVLAELDTDKLLASRKWPRQGRG